MLIYALCSRGPRLLWWSDNGKSLSIQLTLKPCQVAITLVPQELYELSFRWKDSFRDIWDGRKQQKRYQLSLRHSATAEHSRLCESERKPRSCQTEASFHHVPVLEKTPPSSISPVIFSRKFLGGQEKLSSFWRVTITWLGKGISSAIQYWLWNTTSFKHRTLTTPFIYLEPRESQPHFRPIFD